MHQATAMPQHAAVPPVRHLKIPPGSGLRPGVFPFEPVFDLLSPDDTLRKCNGAPLDGVTARIARRLDVDRQYIYRWLRRGLDDRQADVIAIMLGLHPSLLWLDWFAHAPDEEIVFALERKAARHQAALERLAVGKLKKEPIKPKLRIRNLDRRVDRLREMGESWRAIALDLSEAGFTNWRSGRPWQPEDLKALYGAGRLGVSA